MDAKFGSLFESIGNFFTGGEQIPWCDRDVIAGCEREVAEAANGDSEERKNESIMRLSWALVHSRQKEDIQRGIAMLESTDSLEMLMLLSSGNCHYGHSLFPSFYCFPSSLGNDKSPLHQREKLYLLAVGYYRSNDYGRSRQLVEQCLEIAPDWRQALSLKKIVEDRIAKDGVIGIGITATAVGLIVGGIATALARRN
ncbi:Mitochondrial fission 1 protein A [Glycine soja]